MFSSIFHFSFSSNLNLLLLSHLPTYFPSAIYFFLLLYTPAYLLPSHSILPLFSHLFSPFVSCHSHSVAPRLSGRQEPPHLPTTSAAPPCLTVPISPEGWGSAAHSTQASSGAPGTSRGLLTLAGPPLHHYHTATARPGGRMVPQASSASSHRSLCAGE